MNLSKGLLEKAKTAKSAEELYEMAKAESVVITAEDAAKAYTLLNQTSELADDELDNVVGGCGGDGDGKTHCPKCNSVNVKWVKTNKDGDGFWMCNDCNKMFGWFSKSDFISIF